MGIRQEEVSPPGPPLIAAIAVLVRSVCTHPNQTHLEQEPHISLQFSALGLLQEEGAQQYPLPKCKHREVWQSLYPRGNT